MYPKKHDLLLLHIMRLFSLGKSGLVSVAKFSTSIPINTIGIAAEKLDTGNNKKLVGVVKMKELLICSNSHISAASPITFFFLGFFQTI